MLPIRFEYISDIREKVYLSVLRQVTHRYTGETIYRVREEGESGWITEGFRNQHYIAWCLAHRVGE